MARKLRIEFEGGFYHVITRGNQRQKVFREEKDFLKYLEFLSDYKDRYGFWVYAYVLMGTHVHLLIETINRNGTGSFVEDSSGSTSVSPCISTGNMVP